MDPPKVDGLFHRNSVNFSFGLCTRGLGLLTALFKASVRRVWLCITCTKSTTGGGGGGAEVSPLTSCWFTSCSSQFTERGGSFLDRCGLPTLRASLGEFLVTLLGAC
jgi:hypothetical protein